MKNKPLYWSGTAVLFVGMLLAFLPHALHSSIGFTEDDHFKHVIEGIILVLMGLVILILSSKGQNKIR